MEQNTAEWLEFRRSHIGASDAPIIMGKSPFKKTLLDLWEEKVFGKVSASTPAMERGHALEPAARAEFERMSGLHVMPAVVVHPDRDWQMASLDGITFDGSAFVEIKCPREEVHQMALNGEIPEHYQIQMQHQISVVEHEEAFYFSFDGKSGALVKIKRDESFINALLKEEELFLTHMQTKTPPETLLRDYIHKDDTLWAQLADEWKQLSRQLKELEKLEQEVRKSLIEKAEGQSSEGGGIRISRIPTLGALETKRFLTDLRVELDLLGVASDVLKDIEKYRKPSFEKWTFKDCD